jgi:hypothetical protein
MKLNVLLAFAGLGIGSDRVKKKNNRLLPRQWSTTVNGSVSSPCWYSEVPLVRAAGLAFQRAALTIFHGGLNTALES